MKTINQTPQVSFALSSALIIGCYSLLEKSAEWEDVREGLRKRSRLPEKILSQLMRALYGV
ncbi:hypothetical protein NDI37_13895 [Funiculus sociatus GB2-A5]|uniref:Uncharacterized protein n=1 Tax=Funiculus sociatus GB2-A5 TaxID=2933946 RepID=A0ABV0JQ70_9CYAN|nr:MULTISPECIES: hypothetical protein [unclassified Trichocoleus]MBD1908772.1 hypothetical protein [Trichocoleus sp. FACHB-832]MBD2065086.1 hypothetical protein [Trichocoleus sp. FACHB-6]